MSSYGNREEIMDQYNRLLDVFNDETVKEKTINSEIGFNPSAYLNQNTMNQIEQIKKSNNQIINYLLDFFNDNFDRKFVK